MNKTEDKSRTSKGHCTISLYIVPSKMIRRQNNFSSPPTLFETCGRNVTVCPANIRCYHSNTFSITKCCLPATLYKSFFGQLSSTLTNKQTISWWTWLDKNYCCESHNKPENVFLMGSPWTSWIPRFSNKYAPTLSRLYRKNLSASITVTFNTIYLINTNQYDVTNRYRCKE
jgi:hypothetical protein